MAAAIWACFSSSREYTTTRAAPSARQRRTKALPKLPVAPVQSTLFPRTGDSAVVSTDHRIQNHLQACSWFVVPFGPQLSCVLRGECVGEAKRTNTALVAAM